VKPRLVEKGCLPAVGSQAGWNCKFGDIPLDQSKTCCRCLAGKSQWRRKPSGRKQEVK